MCPGPLIHDKSLMMPSAQTMQTDNGNPCRTPRNFLERPPKFSSNQVLATVWLILWTANGIVLGLLNKAAFSIVAFPYPYALTAIHMVVNFAACQYVFYSVERDPSPMKNIWVKLLGERLIGAQQSKVDASISIMWAFSMLFCLNIAIGNVSLQRVSVNFNQVMRSLDPLIMLSLHYFLNKPVSTKKRFAVLPVVVGVVMACLGDRMSVTTSGFIYTFLCVFLGALKVVVSSELMVGSRQLHPVRLLHLMAPMACLQCLVLSWVTGEADEIAKRWPTEVDPFTTGDWKPVSVLLLSSIFAFSLNISALQAYKLTSPLTVCIFSAIKLMLMFIVGTAVFHTRITPLNGVGIFVVLVASTYYSYISIEEHSAVDVQASKDNAVPTTDEEESDVEKDDRPLIIAASASTQEIARVCYVQKRVP